jgi:polygalacturonase
MKIIGYKSILPVVLSVLISSAACSDADKAWKNIYPNILNNIRIPEFKDQIYNIADYGAVRNDPAILNHEAINSTIELCSKNGGGIVYIPDGTWHTGPVVLMSNVNLRLEENAVLMFTSDISKYPSVLTRWEGMDCYNTSPMIYAYGQDNIAITGKGTIDGGASGENWWGMQRLAVIPGQELRGRPLLQELNEKGTPIEERRFGAGDNLRPQLINLYKCRNILISDVTLTRPAFWTIHPLMCENITVKGVTIKTEGAPNGDGCNPESCKNVLIEECFFNTGDDCIAIKSGRNRDGRKWNLATENVIVRKCRMQNGHGGVVIGSEISGGFRNLFVEDCEMNSPSLDRVIRIKTNNCRGGEIENIYVRNVDVGQCREAVLRINLNYEPGEICQRDFPPFIRNVYLENVKCKQSQYGAYIDSYTDSENVTNINLTDCEWINVKEGNRLEGLIEGLKFKGTTINGNPVKD